MDNKYNIQVLIEAVNDYFYAKQEFEEYLEIKMPKDRPFPLANVEREKVIVYTSLRERMNYYDETLNKMCRLVDVDINKLTSVVKAINRFEKNHGRWNRVLHLSYFDEIKLQRFIAADKSGLKLTLKEFKALKLAECEDCDNRKVCNPERYWSQCVKPDDWFLVTEKFWKSS